jgi:hypothetical protein
VSRRGHSDGQDEGLLGRGFDLETMHVAASYGQTT